jgi:hypothetical protein
MAFCAWIAANGKPTRAQQTIVMNFRGNKRDIEQT